MGYRVAVVGATGAVGNEILNILAETEFPADEVVALASARSAGKDVSLGDDKTLKVLLDLMTVKFLSIWSTKPSYLFGGSGALLCLLGTAFVLWTAYQRLFNGVFVYRQPSLVVGVFLFTIGLNLILLGLLAELIVRTHHESQAKPGYLVRDRRNFAEEAEPLR